MMEGKWKVRGARFKVQGYLECGMNVECRRRGRRCWWKENVGGRTDRHKQVHNSHNQPALVNINIIVLVPIRLSLILL